VRIRPSDQGRIEVADPAAAILQDVPRLLAQITHMLHHLDDAPAAASGGADGSGGGGAGGGGGVLQQVLAGTAVGGLLVPGAPGAAGAAAGGGGAAGIPPDSASGLLQAAARPQATLRAAGLIGKIITHASAKLQTIKSRWAAAELPPLGSG
jgi:hypothetical protein